MRIIGFQLQKHNLFCALLLTFLKPRDLTFGRVKNRFVLVTGIGYDPDNWMEKVPFGYSDCVSANLHRV